MKPKDIAKNTITQYKMLSGSDHVLIGLSGGPDSVCLSLVLVELIEDFDLKLSAVYVEHGLRPDETESEIAFCKEFCEANGIGFYVKSVNVREYAETKGLNVQEAARDLRYTAFEEVLNAVNASAIALGHNADDQAETLLMRLFRGSGRKGLSGIPPVRGKIIRPIIKLERSEIEEYLSRVSHSKPQRSGRPYIIDSSNLKDNYFRNWLRNTFMQDVKQKNPSVIKDMCRTADIIREEDDYLEIIVTKTLMRLISRKSDTTIEMFIRPLDSTEKPILRRVLRRAVHATESLRGISFVHIEDIVGLIKNGKAGDSLDLPRGIRVIRDYSLIKITSEKHVIISRYELESQAEVTINEGGLMIRSSLVEISAETVDGKFTVLLNADEIKFPLIIRSRAAGDCFYPFGFGKRKKLQDFFVDEKIARDKRDGVPIVVSGNDIIWVAGYRSDERYKVTETTENILRLELKKI